MGATAGNRNAANGSSAARAWKAGSLVDAVLHLKKAGFAGGIHVIGDRGAAKPDCVPKNLPKRDPQPLEFNSRKAAGHAAGADSGTKEAFVGVNISDPRQEGLVEESGLDRKAAVAEQRGERLGRNGERLLAGNEESRAPMEIGVFEPAKATGIDKAELAAA